MNKLSLYGSLQKGFEVKQNEREKKEKLNPGGDWRGGNSGCITEEGIIIGYNPQDVVLRHLGIQTATTLDDDLIFEAGFTNEDHFVNLLNLAKVSTKCEEEIPVEWALPNGQTITGRPDIVVGSKTKSDFIPEYGVEMKLISSNGKMMQHSHFGQANPTATHVCQAAHYSWRLGVPWVLAYVSRSHYTSFYWKADKFKFDHRSMRISEKVSKSTGAKTKSVVSVGPFISLYDMTWEDDTLLIDEKPTIITKSGIERFFQYCSDCVRDKVIPEAGGDVDIYGKHVDKNPNVLYNKWSQASTESFDDWVEDCKEISQH